MNKIIIAIILAVVVLITPITSIADINKQCMVESGNDARAKSKIGKKAVGYCQIRPKTFYYVTHKLMKTKRKFNINNKIDNTRVANYYMNYLTNQWNKYNPSDRRKLALASYNAGLYNIQKAAKLSNGKSYKVIMLQLPKVTGVRYASITINYVKKVMG